jgi:hypothetical protein
MLDAAVIEAGFFSLSPRDAERLDSFVDIPEEAYVDILHCSSAEAFQELAALLGCDPTESFRLIRVIPHANASIVRAGTQFERALLDHTSDELSKAAIEWAGGPAWRKLDVNPMDLTGGTFMLAAQRALASGRGQPLFAWLTPAVQ